MKNKGIVIGFILACATFFGLGALSSSQVFDVMSELAQRYWRDANNQIMIGSYSDTGYWYFQGRMDARLEDLLLVHRMELTGDL